MKPKRKKSEGAELEQEDIQQSIRHILNVYKA
jgi:hypothetical protein